MACIRGVFCSLDTKTLQEKNMILVMNETIKDNNIQDNERKKLANNLVSFLGVRA
jgi:hypothetical protein